MNTHDGDARRSGVQASVADDAAADVTRTETSVGVCKCRWIVRACPPHVWFACGGGPSNGPAVHD